MKIKFFLSIISLCFINKIFSQSVLDYFPIPETPTTYWEYCNTENRIYSVYAAEKGIGYRQMALFSSDEFERNGIEYKAYILNNETIYRITESAGKQDPFIKLPYQTWDFENSNLFIEYESSKTIVSYKVRMEYNGNIENVNVRFNDCIKIKRRIYENNKYVNTNYYYYAKGYGLVCMDEWVNDKKVSSYIVKYGSMVFPDFDQFIKHDDNLLFSFIDDVINNIPKNSNELSYLFLKYKSIDNNNLSLIGNTFSLLYQVLYINPENKKPALAFVIDFNNREEGLKTLIEYLEGKYKIYAMKTEERIGLDKSLIHYNIALRPKRNIAISINFDSDDNKNIARLYIMNRD